MERVCAGLRLGLECQRESRSGGRTTCILNLLLAIVNFLLVMSTSFVRIWFGDSITNTHTVHLDVLQSRKSQLLRVASPASISSRSRSLSLPACSPPTPWRARIAAAVTAPLCAAHVV